eukprot:scaffold2544_cov401-Prasinococcus_capsulatus_cf.AAC.7
MQGWARPCHGLRLCLAGRQAAHDVMYCHHDTRCITSLPHKRGHANEHAHCPVLPVLQCPRTRGTRLHARQSSIICEC